MFALANEIGCRPDLLRWIVERPSVAVAAAFGQAHAPLFRLDGPFATADASDVVATELLEPIKLRGLMNVVFFGNLCFFAAVNALATLVEWTLAPLARTKHV